MHKRHVRGFTVVELIVIIVVIGIVASMAAIAYSKVQKEGRDTKRDSDMAILINELEAFYDRKGEYPPGCPDTTCPSAMHTANTSLGASTALTTTTTLATLTSYLPGVKAGFGDPQSPNKSLPLKDRTLNEMKYIYFGGTYNNTAASATLDSVTHANFPCTLRSTLSPNAAGSYVVGYFHETTNKWVLKSGRNATQINIAAGLASDGCIITRG